MAIYEVSLVIPQATFEADSLEEARAKLVELKTNPKLPETREGAWSSDNVYHTFADDEMQWLRRVDESTSVAD